jgi:hypothetical protein
MKNKLKVYIQTIKQMPDLLQLFTIAFLFVGILLVISPLLPNDIRGTQQTTYEFWKSGDAATSIILGILLLLISFGFLHRTFWSRPLILIPLVLLYSINYKMSTDSSCGYIDEIIAIISILFWPWYFYFKKSVKVFFESTRK